MSESPNRNELQPDEVCESCRAAPATQVMFRSGNIQLDSEGRPVAEIEPRIAVCRPCWEELVSDQKPPPPARIIRQL
jgi:hypothetical protein